MKRLVLTALTLLLLVGCQEQEPQIIKVACVGDSITFGAGIANREKNSYPAQLQEYLGDGYEVKNFGVSATTVLCEGNYPYVETDQYKASLEYNPDIVFIKMGTNAAANRNVEQRPLFEQEYRKFVDTYRNLPSKPRVILLTPVRSFLERDHGDDIIRNEIIPVINKTAYELNLDIVNLHNIFGDKWADHIMPDKLHPSSIGAGQMAAKLYKYLTLDKAKKSDVVSKFALQPVAEFNFHGYKGYQYDNNGVKYYIVEPHQAVKGNPWIWRARFWGHEPQVDIDLLEQGFYLTYCEVGDLFGAEEAVERWNEFYRLATKAGLNKKAVLEGMSRGGLIVYNWAVKNLNKVACIYADAPVMDIKSWPMDLGKDTSTTDGNVKNMMSAYGFASVEEACAWDKNPIDHAEQIAKAGISILHVVGDADEVVPVEENTAIFEQSLAEYGYKLNVIHKPGVGHHPHSLNNPSPIVDFILNATNRAVNMCVRSVPGNEYRSAAGWTAGSDWHAVSEDINATIEGRQLKLLLLGNSITQGFGGNRARVVGKAGKAAMDAAVGKDEWEPAGISGDRTQHLLWRLQNGDYNRCNPQVAVITIGVNNITAGDTPENIAQGIIACAKEARKQLPDTRIILFGVLPAGRAADSAMRVACNEIHDYLAKNRVKGVEYVNPTEWFVKPDGSMYEELYGGDFLHLSVKGYEMWSKKIAELIAK